MANNYEFKPNTNNYVTFTGLATKDGEVRATTKSTVTNFTLAYNKRKRVGDEWVNDKTIYVDCSMFNCPMTISKGMKITVRGSLDQSNWTAKDGTNRSKLYISVKDIPQTPTQAAQVQPSSEVPAAPVRTEDQIVNETYQQVFANDSDIPF